MLWRQSHPMLRAVFALALLAAPASPLARAAETAALAGYAQVEVSPSKTSIYIGMVSLVTPPLVRKAGSYETSYRAKVFPYFFYNEAGGLSIDVSDEQLRTLARGEPIEFTGRGVREDGAERRVEGKATPTDARSGKLKMRVFVSKKVELIFNTTYRFLP